MDVCIHRTKESNDNVLCVLHRDAKTKLKTAAYFVVEEQAKYNLLIRKNSCKKVKNSLDILWRFC